MLKKFFFGPVIRKVLDVILSPLTLIGSLWFRYIRARHINQMPISKSVFSKVGVYPIADHYYEPLFNFNKHLTKPLDQDRVLPGLDLNETAQVKLINQFRYNNELQSFPTAKRNDLEYYYYNPSYPAGDGELLYNMLRHIKPKQIIEIGCGYSTLMIQNAIKKNKEEGSDCVHECIEPYEMPWLEKLPINIIRKKVEDIDLSFFQKLEESDLLFIDSSHMIRPQGDVLFEFLQILPLLNKGVIVHVHDIFTPRDYPEQWIKEFSRFWNEQYLLEAFLSNNSKYQVLLAANFLVHHYREELLAVCPVLAKQKEQEPGSFWIKSV
jgi:hypothetical protein